MQAFHAQKGELMDSLEDRKIVGMEDTILRWKRTSETVRTCLIGTVIICGLLTILFSAKSDRLVIWIICFLAGGLLTFCDITLQRYITEGERELYSASLDLIERKEKLASLGVIDFDADASRRFLNMHMPDRKVHVPLALYIIADGTALAGMIIALVKFF